MNMRLFLIIIIIDLLFFLSQALKANYIFVSNENSDTLSVIDAQSKIEIIDKKKITTFMPSVETQLVMAQHQE